MFFSSCASVDFHYDLFTAAEWPVPSEIKRKKDKKNNDEDGEDVDEDGEDADGLQLQRDLAADDDDEAVRFKKAVMSRKELQRLNLERNR